VKTVFASLAGDRRAAGRLSGRPYREFLRVPAMSAGLYVSARGMEPTGRSRIAKMKFTTSFAAAPASKPDQKIGKSPRGSIIFVAAESWPSLLRHHGRFGRCWCFLRLRRREISFESLWLAGPASDFPLPLFPAQVEAGRLEFVQQLAGSLAVDFAVQRGAAGAAPGPSVWIVHRPALRIRTSAGGHARRVFWRRACARGGENRRGAACGGLGVGSRCRLPASVGIWVRSVMAIGFLCASGSSADPPAPAFCKLFRNQQLRGFSAAIPGG
jgi:hypothetical protein